MAFIEPLSLQTWFVNVFAGSPDIFGAVALILLAGLAGYFRMNGLSMFFMIGIFFLMFSGFITPTLIILIMLIASLLVGYWLSRLIKS